MEDPNFKRSVILLAEHSDSGTMGFVVNKPLEVTLLQLTDDLFEQDAPLYFGGPVNLDRLHFLHRVSDKIDGGEPILEDLHFGGDIRQLKQLINLGIVNVEDLRFLIGYSGWGKGQLKKEIKLSKSWAITECGLDVLTSTPPTELWRVLMARMGGLYKIFSNFPEDPREN